MKYIRKITWIGIMIAIFASCQDNQIEKYDPPTDPKPDPTVSWLEYLKSYNDLKTYIDRAASPGFKLGAGILIPEFIAKGDKYNLYLANFDQITLGNEMKHDNVVQADGTLNLTNVSNLISAAKDAGMSVYGHTLVWHSQQRAGYMNKLIAPTILPGVEPGRVEIVTNGNFQTDDLSSFQFAGVTTSFTPDGQGPNGKGRALAIVVPKVGTNTWDSQAFIKFDNPMQAGETYTFSMDVRSDANAGFDSQAHTVPTAYLHWDFFGRINATPQWTTYKKTITITAQQANAGAIAFNMAEVATTFYFANVSLIRISPKVTNGDFSTDDLNTSFQFTNNAIHTFTPAGEGPNGQGRALKITNETVYTNDWECQFFIKFAPPVKAGEKYRFTMDVRSDDNASYTTQAHTVPQAYIHWDFVGTINSTPQWTTYDRTITVSAEQATAGAIAFNLGHFATTYYIANISFNKLEEMRSDDIIIEMTPGKKDTLITAELDRWIKGIVGVAGEYVKDWDVVNEPMDDAKPNELKTTPATPGASEFYWQDYMGKDYAAKAISSARKYGSDLRLFINDYNLEYNLNKCRGLIDFVKYTDDVCQSMGVKGVDGIGTQMHINVTSNRNNIEEMFKLLAATGKLIKITEMDLGLGGNPPITTPDATPDLYKAQADLYQFVVQKYFELIPAAQRAGITIWGPFDSPDTPYSWRRNEPIGLWNLEFIRKPAYGGFANGLAGRDISANP